MKLMAKPFRRREWTAIVCFFVFLSGVLLSFAEAQPVFYTVNRPFLDASSQYRSGARSIIDLNGIWEYSTDGETWGRVRVPSTYFERASVEFRREFSLPAGLSRNRAFYLSALGIHYYAEVYINGHLIGKHSGPGSFTLGIAERILKPGRNSIRIKASNYLKTFETVPGSERLWGVGNSGGIVKDIAVIATSPVWFASADFDCSLSRDGRAGKIRLKGVIATGAIAGLSSDSLSAPIRYGKTKIQYSIEVFDLQNGVSLTRSSPQFLEVESHRKYPVSIELQVPDIQAWSPSIPNRYGVRLKIHRGAILLDENSFQVGFKKIEVRKQAIFLNGKPITLKGFTYRVSSPRTGVSLSRDEMEQDVIYLKNIGANAIRILSSPVHPYFLTLCDQYGLLVFEDLPLFDVPTPLLSRGNIRSLTLSLYQDILASDRNHPSLTGIGLGSGYDPSDKPITECFPEIRKGGRVLLYAGFVSPPGDKDLENLDLVFFDIPFFHQHDVVEKLHEWNERKIKLPFIVGSLSYPVEVGNNNGYSDPSSSYAQAEFYRSLWPLLDELNAQGRFIDTYVDYITSCPIMITGGHDMRVASTGIVDMNREKRIAYDVLKALFNNERTPDLVIGSYDPPNPPVFIIIGILIILFFAVMFNLFRRFRENVFRSIRRSFNFFADIRDQRMISIFQTTVVGLLSSLSAALYTTGLLFYFRTNPTMDFLFTLVFPSSLKQYLIQAAWNPFLGIVIFSLIYFLLLLIATVIIKLFSLAVHRRLFLFDAYSVAMWSVIPFLLLAPFAMILHQLMELPFMPLVILAVFFVFHLWGFTRLLKGVAIVFDFRPVFAYLAGYFVLIVLKTYYLLSLNASTGLFAQIEYHFRSVSFWSQFLH
ncbi:MAG: hypothetical protein GXO82_01465 [Chlorobi bacterium]|nr:hypothetical protein [Chlorobiota bacterium]